MFPYEKYNMAVESEEEASAQKAFTHRMNVAVDRAPFSAYV